MYLENGECSKGAQGCRGDAEELTGRGGLDCGAEGSSLNPACSSPYTQKEEVIQ